jgi:probable F420-dependent oxidoreductase
VSGHVLRFGVTVILDPPHEQSIGLLELAEAHGFDHGWVFDSHVISEEPYPLLGLAAARTSRIRLGICVTNPTSRDPTVTASAHATLHELSGGRAVLGLGRGDSAVRMIGLEPARLGPFEESIGVIRELANGRPVDWRGTRIHFPWAAGRPEIPVHVAAYGPKALGVAGRAADGVFVQLADPDLVAFLMGIARRAAAEAGRDPAALECIVCAPAVVTDDLARARDETRFFPAMVSNHVLDLLRRTDRAELPPALWRFVDRREGYDYEHHARTGAAHGDFVDDETCDRFCLLGPLEAHLARLRELEAAGATQVNLYLLAPGKEALVEAYGRDVIPVLGGVKA